MSPVVPERRVSLTALLACSLAGLAGLALVAALPAQSASGMQNTKHNLALSGPGPIQGLTETRICVFCHTPHNAAPDSPLWNRELEPQFYTVYASPTLRAGVLPQPFGPTKLCLSCHDGTIAMGAVLNPAGGIQMSGSDTLPPGSLSDFGLDLSGHHPVSFSYNASLPNPELEPTPPEDLVFGGADEIHCSTCHDPHDEGFGRFLVKDNRFSELCIRCHKMDGWATSAHATSNDSVGGIVPIPPKTWPTWTRMREWGCEGCHTPHFAATGEQLLNFTYDPPTPFGCTSCHGTDPHAPLGTNAAAGAASAVAGADGRATVRPDIARQVSKISSHPEAASVRSGLPRGRGVGSRAPDEWLGCIECHDPHGVNGFAAELPYVSGSLAGVLGVDRNGAEVATATYEYEICFRCHGDNTPDAEFIPRVVASTNTRLDFDPNNPSYHPVVEMGRGVDVPSLPSALSPRMSPSDRIGCTSCHADDEGGSRGPHGSDYPPILAERYDTIDGSVESYESYALCYRCHERTSILGDQSFAPRAFRTTPSGGGHSGHLAAGAPCSACHDPHGVSTGNAAFQSTGDHTHLINFDVRIVAPLAGADLPVFKDTGSRSGSCTLTCHGVNHLQTAYP
jgi:predicted CXXCH cytochrome family protein